MAYGIPMDTVDISPDDLTIRQAAELLDKTPKTIRRYVKSGLLPRRYVNTIFGAALTFSRTEVERLRDVDEELSTLPIAMTTPQGLGQTTALSTLPFDGEAVQELVQGYQLLVQGYQRTLERSAETTQHAKEHVQTLQTEVSGLRQDIQRLGGIETELATLRALLERRAPRPWWKFWARTAP